MRKIIYTLIFTTLLCDQSIAQKTQPAEQFKQKMGIKAGYNWSYVTGTESNFDPKSNNGFMVAGFFAPAAKGMGYRTEIVFSRQGYSFDEGGKETEIQHDYIYLPQLTTYTIGKHLQLQAGGQIGYLLKAQKKTESKDSTITNLMNRFDYGFAAGIEIYPFNGFIVGGRYNLGLGKLYKRYEQQSGNPYPLPFNPETTNLKNGLFQFFVGYRF